MQTKKSLGQNFLRDESIIAKIINAVGAQEGECLVEVGPGEGVLTDQLARSGARVLAVEIDDRLIPVLRQKYASYPNVRIHHGNILRTFLAKEMKEIGWKCSHYRVVGNLPYYITSSIIRMFLESEIKPKEAYFMVQKEVAERIVAPKGEMSILAVAVQYYADVEILFVVPKEAFLPIPKVESAFVKFVPFSGKTNDLTSEERKDRDKKFFRVVRAGFSARRKTLANNLSNSLHIPKEKVLEYIRALGYLETVRPQELSVKDWIAVESQIHSLASDTGQSN